MGPTMPFHGTRIGNAFFGWMIREKAVESANEFTSRKADYDSGGVTSTGKGTQPSCIFPYKVTTYSSGMSVDCSLRLHSILFRAVEEI